MCARGMRKVRGLRMRTDCWKQRADSSPMNVPSQRRSSGSSTPKCPPASGGSGVMRHGVGPCGSLHPLTGRGVDVDRRLAVRRDHGVEVDQLGDALWYPVGDALDDQAGVAVSDEHDLLELLRLEQTGDVVDVCLQSHLGAEQGPARTRARSARAPGPCDWQPRGRGRPGPRPGRRARRRARGRTWTWWISLSVLQMGGGRLRDCRRPTPPGRRDRETVLRTLLRGRRRCAGQEV